MAGPGAQLDELSPERLDLGEVPQEVLRIPIGAAGHSCGRISATQHLEEAGGLDGGVADLETVNPLFYAIFSDPRVQVGPSHGPQ